MLSKWIQFIYCGLDFFMDFKFPQKYLFLQKCNIKPVHSFILRDSYKDCFLKMLFILKKVKNDECMVLIFAKINFQFDTHMYEKIFKALEYEISFIHENARDIFEGWHFSQEFRKQYKEIKC
ncbi:hypothetical protein CCZ01_07405 [Helicobacter monodelphidis]|uniref:hypothetical protein n=1 Tax=Helicobacter sp. 15-1451 TaxID=2004995 RepID=UPI000DCCA885|nr:hypothetical protein [Helicobacter sp. 15-1451]RAX57063.1 hypothetical protein CCZ01_07405 [Helicobacter sp. 15-1451]